MKINEKTKLVGTATLGSKGQIVIPASIRQMFGLVEGDTLLVLADKKKGIAIVKSDFVTKWMDQEETK